MWYMYSFIRNYKCDRACNQDNQNTVQLLQCTYDISKGNVYYAFNYNLSINLLGN